MRSIKLNKFGNEKSGMYLYHFSVRYSKIVQSHRLPFPAIPAIFSLDHRDPLDF